MRLPRGMVTLERSVLSDWRYSCNPVDRKLKLEKFSYTFEAVICKKKKKNFKIITFYDNLSGGQTVFSLLGYVKGDV